MIGGDCREGAAILQVPERQHHQFIAGGAVGVDPAGKAHPDALAGARLFAALEDNLLQDHGAVRVAGDLLHGEVPADGLEGGAGEPHLAPLHEQHAGAEFGHPLQLVRHHQHRDAAPGQLFHPAEGALLEFEVAHREHLVDNQNIGREVRRNGKAEAGVHAAGVALDRGVDERPHARELDDVVEAIADEAAGHPHDGALKEHVLLAGQVLVKTGCDLDQRAHPAAGFGPAQGGRDDAREGLEDGGLSRAIAADDAHDLSRAHREAHVLEGPELVEAELRRAGTASHQLARQRGDEIAEAVVALAPLELLPDVVELDPRSHTVIRHFPRTPTASDGRSRWISGDREWPTPPRRAARLAAIRPRWRRPWRPS